MNKLAIMQKLPSLDAVLSFQNSEIVKKLARELILSEADALQLFQDTKRFLYLAAITKAGLRPSRKIDDGWHQFILFTRDYADFCFNHFGRFIHHQPDKEQIDKKSQSVDTLDLAKSIFGDDLSKNWFANRVDCSPDTNCESDPSDCAKNIGMTKAKSSCESNCSANCLGNDVNIALSVQ